jgi:hypothetical protein
VCDIAEDDFAVIHSHWQLIDFAVMIGVSADNLRELYAWIINGMDESCFFVIPVHGPMGDDIIHEVFGSCIGWIKQGRQAFEKSGC